MAVIGICYYHRVSRSSSPPSPLLRPLRRRPLPSYRPFSGCRYRCCCCCCYSGRPVSLSAVNTTLSHIHNTGVVACLRAHSAELAMEAACAALNGGISVVLPIRALLVPATQHIGGCLLTDQLFSVDMLEIVMSTPGVFEVLQQLAYDYPTSTLGVGTVLNAKDAKRAINAGAKFLMSPAMVKDILDDVQGSEALYIPGVMTPTEILSACDAGAKIIKVFPVSVLGGIRYIAALSKPFSHISMIASQGITIESIGEYIAQGASSVVLSDVIFNKEAIVQRNFGQIRQLAQRAALLGNEAVKRKRLYDPTDFRDHE